MTVGLDPCAVGLMSVNERWRPLLVFGIYFYSALKSRAMYALRKLETIWNIFFFFSIVVSYLLPFLFIFAILSFSGKSLLFIVFLVHHSD